MSIKSEVGKRASVEHRLSHNNLHITCSKFEQNDASAVMGLMRRFHTDCKRIFIDVRHVQVPTTVAQTFKTALSHSEVSPRQVFFKGSMGFDLAINGNRVLIQKENAQKPRKQGHVCCGKCAHCHCHDNG